MSNITALKAYDITKAKRSIEIEPMRNKVNETIILEAKKGNYSARCFFDNVLDDSMFSLISESLENDGFKTIYMKRPIPIPTCGESYLIVLWSGNNQDENDEKQ